MKHPASKPTRKSVPTSVPASPSGPIGTSNAGPSNASTQQAFAPLPIGEEEPPPTYEEAIGDTMAPIDGPRNYQPPPVTGRGFPVDEKR